ncbi:MULTISPECIES: glycosyltransferase family 2 protein [unclassified Frankia]|uniref:glycosyltransferase family 2 protein n=1 Tax=unclassified Frankia TaxID=2632575 RepID=UPI001EF5B3D1|nr:MULTISPECIES: glycosyltransferase family 2 protein [unclassified Frankia]
MFETSRRPVAPLSVSIVIPTLNEAKNIPGVFRRLPPDAEIILVDGRSTDDTIRVACEIRPDTIVVRQTRRGKGNALACGFAASTGDFIVMLDADGSADPSEIPAFLDALRNGADFAKGTRFAHGGGSADITRARQLGNRALCFLANRLFGQRFTDLCYGYNAFSRTCLAALGLTPGQHNGTRQWGDGFEIETLIMLRVAAAGLRITEVGSFERPRVHGESNLRASSDGLRVLRTILSERLHRRDPLIGQAAGCHSAASAAPPATALPRQADAPEQPDRAGSASATYA